MNKNYTLIKETFIEEVHSKAMLLKHNKSGARVCVLSNDDDNKVFAVGFRTPPVDNTGVPHIMEHSTLCGSKKFPVKDPFVELLKSSLNTFLNAITFPDKTVYPIASCNDKDFANLMEVYMDAVFYPNVYIHEEIFKQEGWHYELEDKDAPITFNGVVYNEMKGAFSSPDQVVFRNIMHSLYPDTSYGVESGGVPEFIPDLTYEAFKNFHGKLYHPSNSYIFLYGNMDVEERLEFMDKEYLSNFDVIKVDSEIAYQKPFASAKYEHIYYPIGKDEDAENKTYYSYNAVIGDYKDTKLNTAINVLTYALLDKPGAPLKQALLDANIGSDISSIYEPSLLQPFIGILAEDAPEGKMEEFKALVDKELRRIVKEGIDKKSLLAAINYFDFKNREADFGGAPKGLMYFLSGMMDTWLYNEDDPFSRLQLNKIYQELKEDAKGDYFEKLIEKYLINNSHVSYVTCSPSKTVSEEEQARVAKRLADYKASLTDEQIEKLIEDTKALKIYQATPSTDAELATVPKLSINDIKKDVEFVKRSVEEVDETKVVKHEIFTNGINYLKFMFDMSGVDNDLVPYIGLLASCLGSVSTQNYTYADLSNEVLINTGGIGFSATAYENKDRQTKPYFVVDASTLDDKLEFTFDIINEIIKTSKLDDKKRVGELVKQNKTRSQGMFIGNGMGSGIARAQSYFNATAKYNDMLGGIDQYKFIEDLDANFEEKFNDTVAKIQKLLKIIFRKENLIYSYTNTSNLNPELIKKFNENLFTDSVEKGKFVFTPNFANEGFKTSSVVQFACQAGNYSKVGKYTGAFQVLNKALTFDYLWNKIRVLGGAYGCACRFAANGDVVLGSYRDPKLAETYEVFKGIPAFIESYDHDIEKHIIGAIGDLDLPYPPRRKGDVDMNRYIGGILEEDVRRERSEIINCTYEDIKALIPLFEEALKTGAICTIGNEKKIEENKDLFNETKNLFK